jgi:hypothetical protein
VQSAKQSFGVVFLSASRLNESKRFIVAARRWQELFAVP